MGCGEARNLKDDLRQTSSRQLDTDTGVGHMGGLLEVRELIVRL